VFSAVPSELPGNAGNPGTAGTGASFRGLLSVLELDGSTEEWQVLATPLLRTEGLRTSGPRNAGRMSHKSIPWQWQGAI